MSALTLTEGPHAGRQIETTSGLVVIPSIEQCNHRGCLFLHIRTDEYLARGERAGTLYRSFTSLGLSRVPDYDWPHAPSDLLD